jgi:hypothetical protein
MTIFRTQIVTVLTWHTAALAPLVYPHMTTLEKMTATLLKRALQIYKFIALQVA